LILWGVFAVFECAAAMEEDALEEVLNACYKMAVSGPPPTTYTDLSTIVKKSVVAFEIFKQHGWMDDAAKEKYATAGHLLELCRFLHEAKECKVESALEIKRWRIVSFFGQLLHSALPHKLLKLRLRIAPAAELSGLGSLDIDRRGLLRNAKHLIASMQHETSSMQEASTATLELDVRELNKMIHSQDLLLTALATRRRHGAPRTASKDIPSPCYGSQNPLCKSETPTPGSRSSSKGKISFHYEADSTPPASHLGHLVPSTIGRQERHGNPRRQPFNDIDDTLSQVARKLQEVVGNEQQLMKAIRQPPTAVADRSPNRSPATPGKVNKMLDV
jgi:hypothetical protein